MTTKPEPPEEYKEHVEALLAPVKAEIAALRAQMAALKTAAASPEGDDHGH